MRILSIANTLAMKGIDILRTVEVIPEEKEYKYLNSATQDSKSLGEYWGEAICEAFTYIMHKIEPFIEYGLKISFLVCLVVFLSTNDKRTCAKALKIFFIYLIYEIIIGAL